MKKLACSLFVTCLSLAFPAFAQITATPVDQSPKTIAMSTIHPAMRGVACTVFEGVKPESMDVEVLGVLHNVNGPKGDIILVRLHGQKGENSAVVEACD